MCTLYGHLLYPPISSTVQFGWILFNYEMKNSKIIYKYLKNFWFAF